MNRKNLTAAVLAGLAGVAGIVGSAQAVNINPDGLGEVLIFPYYTTNADNFTILSVVNTSDEAKAVKVRFLEGKNSREVLDFNLYMSKYDVWTASVYMGLEDPVNEPDADLVPMMATGDNSCTVPYIYGRGNRPFGAEGGQAAFLPYAMNDEEGYDPDDLTTLGDISRATEGHFEVIEMGVLTDEDMKSATAITHVKGELPAGGCAQLVAAWTDPDDLTDDDEGYWLGDYINDDDVQLGPFLDMDDPIGGLFGGAAIVNVGDGTMYSYDATAVDGFSSEQMHQMPGNTLPNLNSGDEYTGYVFVDGNTQMHSFYYDDTPRGVDAVSYVFMHDSLMNEYSTNGNIGGSTEWVVTFPTKHFYVYQPNSGSALPVDPFTSVWDGSESCEIVLLDTIWDRNEQQPGTPDEPTGEPIPPIVSPAPPSPPDPTKPAIVPFELCYETNVVKFGLDTDDIFGSSNLHTIDNDTELFTSVDGWARFELDDYPHDFNENGEVDCEDGEGKECFSRDPLGNLEGLPVAGFAAMRFENQFLGPDADKIANYGGIFGHKYTRKESSFNGTAAQ